MAEQIQVEVTDIAVTIEDGVKAREDYAPARKANVTLKATVGEGTDPNAALEYVRQLADAKVYEIIHNKPNGSTQLKAAPVASAAAQSSPSSTTASPATGAVPSDKEKLEAEAVKAAGGTSPKFPAANKSKKTTKAKKEEPKAEEGEEAVTDAELSEACTKKVTALNNDPSKVSALLVKYGGRPAPKQVRDIPQEKRKDFLKELDEL